MMFKLCNNIIEFKKNRMLLFVLFMFFTFIIMFIIKSIFNVNVFYQEIIPSPDGNDGMPGCDFFMMISEVGDLNPYNPNNTYSANNPPMAFLVFYVFFLLINKKNINNYNGLNVQRVLYNDFLYGEFFLLYTIFFISIFVVLICLFFKGKKRNDLTLLYSFVLIFSSPFLYAVQQGNIIIVSFVFCIIFFICVERNNLFFKELSLFSLSVASAIKIYPAIFGLFLIKRKKMLLAFLLFIQGVVLFFLPFFFFKNNISKKFSVFLKYFFQFNDRTGNGKLGLNTIYNAFNKIFNFSFIDMKNFTFVLYLIFLIIILFIFFKTKKTYVEILMLVMALLLLRHYNLYNLIFLILPLNFLIGDDNNKLIDDINFISISFLLSPILYAGWKFSSYLTMIIIVLLLIANFISEIYVNMHMEVNFEKNFST